MEKEYTSPINCVFLIPWSHLQGVGIRQQHSGRCCSEIAFTEPSTRTGWGIQPGEAAARRLSLVHRDGQCTLSLPRTQRGKGKDLIVASWQVLRCRRPLHPSLCPSVFLFTCRPVPRLQFHDVCVILHATSFKKKNKKKIRTGSLSLSRVFSAHNPLFFFFFFFYTLIFFLLSSAFPALDWLLSPTPPT